MSDDVDALMAELGIPRADIFGYSMGAGTALQLAIRHPEGVDRMALASVGYRSDGQYPEVLEAIAAITRETFAGTPYEEEYRRLAPNPNAFPTLVEKLVTFDRQPFPWAPGSPGSRGRCGRSRTRPRGPRRRGRPRPADAAARSARRAGRGRRSEGGLVGVEAHCCAPSLSESAGAER
jgi:pimeloyl-ACP methyl ester carboxylesterase